MNLKTLKERRFVWARTHGTPVSGLLQAAIGLLCVATTLTGCALDRAHRERPRPKSIADPDFLRLSAETRRFSLGEPTSHGWVRDGSALLFLRSAPRSFVRDLYEFDVATGRERLLLSADQILQGAEENLSAEERARRERLRMSARGIASYSLSKDGSKILVPLSDRLFVIERETGEIIELESDVGFPLTPTFSPDGAHVACVRNGDLYTIEIATGEERRLTFRSGEAISHGLAEFIAQEEMRRGRGFWWSPDSRTIAYQRTDESDVETLYIMDAGRPELPPRGWRYPRPGKANAKVELGLISLGGGETRWIDWDAARYPYLATVKWREGAPLTILVQNREQTENVLLKVRTETGRTERLLTETDPAWVRIDPAMPRWLPDGKGFLWTTERRGDRQLELRGADGSLERILTPLAVGFRDLFSVNESGTEAMIYASPDPIERYVYAVDLTADDDGAAPAEILATTGTHSAGAHLANFTPDHELYLHRSYSFEGKTPWEVRRRGGEVLGTLTSHAEKPPFLPEVEITTAKGKHDFRASIVRPRNFDPSIRYPLIENVYGGPSWGMVSTSALDYLMDQWMADHGFIVVRLDGRGTQAGGRDWSRVIDGNFIDVPLADHVDGLKALGRQYPELDLSRAGIFGWSFGGYFSAMAVMRHPELYRAGVAGAPVVDWADYDTHYTERYLGLPEKNPEGYRKSNVLTYADQLRRPLLIIHGTTDDNVYFTHSLKLSDALFRAGIDHQLLPLSNFTHMVADPLFSMRRYETIMRFFQRHLVDEAD